MSDNTIQDALRFIRSSISRRDYEPALTHFRIQQKRISGFNGVIGLSAPFASELDIAPNGHMFLRALQACEDTVTMVYDEPKLRIHAGRFKTTVSCLPVAEYKGIRPEGAYVEVKGSMLTALKKLAPFIATDASRPWARGVLFRGQCAYATNNVIAIQYWLDSDFPVELNIPEQAVDELLRINEEPLGLQVSDESTTFYFTGGRWMTTRVNCLGWPDVNALLDKCFEHTALMPFPNGFFDAIGKLKNFVDSMGRIEFADDGLVAVAEDTSTTYAGENFPTGGVFNNVNLSALEGVASSIDFTKYPQPAPFVGDNLRGVIIGMRQ